MKVGAQKAAVHIARLCTIALFIFLFVLVCWALMSDPRTSSELWKFDWQAIGAFMTFVAALVALGIATADRFFREKERRDRAAMMSLAIDHELTLLSALAKYAVANGRHDLARIPVLHWNDNETAQNALAPMIHAIEMLKIPLLERFIERAADFDTPCAAQLIKTTSAILQLTSREVPVSKLSANEKRFTVEVIVRQLHAIRREAIRSRRRLRKYRNMVARVKPRG